MITVKDNKQEGNAGQGLSNLEGWQQMVVTGVKESYKVGDEWVAQWVPAAKTVCLDIAGDLVGVNNFHMQFRIYGNYEHTTDDGTARKDNTWKVTDLFENAGLKPEPTSNGTYQWINERLIGKTIDVYLYKESSGYYRIHDRVPKESSEYYKTKVENDFELNLNHNSRVTISEDSMFQSLLPEQDQSDEWKAQVTSDHENTLIEDGSTQGQQEEERTVVLQPETEENPF